MNPQSLKDLVPFFLYDGKTLASARIVCKKFRDIIDTTQSLWKRAYLIENPGISPNSKPLDISWKDYYRNQYIVNKNMSLNNFGAPFRFGIRSPIGSKIIVKCGKIYITNGEENLIQAYEKNGKSFQIEWFSDTLPKWILAANQVKSIDTNHFLINTVASQFTVWNALEDRCVYVKDIPQHAILHAENSCLIYSTFEGNLEVWDCTIREVRKSFPIPEYEEKLRCTQTYLQNNILFVQFSRQLILVYDIEKGTLLYSKKTNFSATFLASFPYLILIQNISNEAHVYDINTDEKIFSLALATNDAKIYCDKYLTGIPYNRRNFLAVWDLQTGKVVNGFITPKGVVTAHFHSSKYIFIFTGRPSLTVWDIHTGTLLHSIKYKTIPKFIPQQQEPYLSYHVDYRIHFWNLHTCTYLNSISEYLQPPKMIAFDTDNIIVIRTLWDHAIDVYTLNALPRKSLFRRIVNYFSRKT